MAQDITVIPRKHKSKRDRALASAEAQPPAAPEPGSSEPKPKKKKRSKTAEGTDHADVPTEVAEVPGSEPGTDEKRKKKARTVEEEVETAPDIAPSTDIRKEKKKKRKDRDAETEEHVPVLEPVTVEAQLAGTETKKKKKSKTQDSSAVESSQAASSVPESAALSAPAVADADKPKKIKKPKWSAERKAEAKKERAAKSKEAEAAVVPDMPTTEVTVPATEDATPPAVADITTSSSEPRKKRKKRATKQDAAELPAPTEPLSASPAREKQSAKAHKLSSPKSPQRRSSSPVPSKKDATVEESAASDASAGADDTVDIAQIGDEDEEAGSGSEKGDVEQNASEDDENDLHLHGFSSGEDSSDDEMDAEEFNGFDVSSLPTIARDDATVKRKLDKAKRQPTEDRGVIYLGRIPHGFYEDQMRAYFSQFGDVTRLRLSRSKKTGRSKHYGFIEFDSAAVAGIVAETMNNYLLMGHILKCKVIPKEEVHPSLWIGANRKWHQVPRDRLARVRHNKPRTEDAQHIAESRLLKRQQAKKRKLLEVGIDYDFDAVAYKKPKAIPLVD